MADGAELSLPVNANNLLGFADRLVSVLSDVTPGMAEIALTLKSQVGRTFANQTDPVTGASWDGLVMREGKPLRDTGRLLQSLIASNPVVNKDTAQISTNLIYANVHQYGATIYPKRSKYLAIPIAQDAKTAGSARRYFNKKRRITMRGMVLGIMVGRGPNARFEPKFVLKKSVTIPARPYLGYSDEYADEIVDVMRSHIFSALGFTQTVREFTAP